MNTVDDEPKIPARDARTYARKVFRHYGIKSAKFDGGKLLVELRNGDHGYMWRSQQSTTWEPVTVGKAHRAKWKWFVENWLWSLKFGDTLGIDLTGPSASHDFPKADMCYKPIIRPLRSRDLTSLAIELDLLGRGAHAKQ